MQSTYLNIRPLLVFLILCFGQILFSQNEIDYNWKNVPIGGGGYITGMQVHPLDPDVRIYRTDVGGAYRFNSVTQRFDQLIFSTEKSHYSVAGIAFHPEDTDIIYLAVGRDCDASTSGIFESTDGGESFIQLNITGDTDIYFAANGGRGCSGNNEDKDRQGTPIAINPHNTNELYIGARDNGLFILDRTTLVSTQIAHDEIPHNTNRKSIRSVVFHPNETLVYIAYADEGVFMGDTETQDFWQINGSEAAFNSIDISISKDADYMIVACKREGILKCSNLIDGSDWSFLTNGLDTDFSDEPNSQGFLTVDCSPLDNNKIVTVSADWHHINEFHVSTDAGDSWHRVDGDAPDSQNAFPWRKTGFASHVAQIAFDPEDEQILHFTSWFASYMTTDFSYVDGGTWGNLLTKGHEEIVPTDVMAFPSNTAGNFVISGSGDHTGFIFNADIEDPDIFPEYDISELANGNLGQLKKSAGYAFCEKQPDYLAAVVTDEWIPSEGGLLYSVDGGLSWDLKDGYDPDDLKSMVEISSDDPDNIVIFGPNGLKYSMDGANTSFINSAGTTSNNPTCEIPFEINCLESTNVNTGHINTSVFAGARNITADKELPCVFYYYDWDGSFSISTNGGEDWCVVHNDLSSLPAISTNNQGEFNIWNKTRVISIPGHPGHVWININNILFFSQDGGASWENRSSQTGIDKVRALSFGLGVDESYAAIYAFGTIDGSGIDRFYRSDDMGMTWNLINNHDEKELWTDSKMIAGDRNVPGRLFAAVGGQGVIFGDDIEATTEVCSVEEQVINGLFDNPNDDIPSFNLHNSGSGTSEGYINESGEAVIEIASSGDFDYQVQMWQDNLEIEAGQAYQLTTIARADAPRTMNIKLRNRADGSITYHETALNLNESLQIFTHDFIAPNDDNDLRLTHLMGESDIDVYFDQISLKKVIGNDEDADGFCDGVDQCPEMDDMLIGMPCEDGDPCTSGETFDSNCNCSGGVNTWIQSEANDFLSASVVVNPDVIGSSQDIVNIIFVLYNGGDLPLSEISIDPSISILGENEPLDLTLNPIWSNDPNDTNLLEPEEVWFYTLPTSLEYNPGDVFVISLGASGLSSCGEEIAADAELLFSFGG